MKLFLGLSALLVSLAQTASQELLPPATEPEEGGFVQAGLQGQNIYGNNVTFRTAYLPSGAQKLWIDFESSLPSGSLEYFYIYVHNVSSATTSTEFIRLQIWRPVDLTEYQYKLVWERRVEVPYNLNRGALYTYENDVDFRVASGDRVGWTFEGSTGIISFQYVEEHKTYFRKVKDVGFPVFQETYTFDNIHLPSIFSAAVKIDPNCEVGFYGVNCEEECGRCKDDLCSEDDGHCLDGCQIWFIGDLCRVEIALPSLAGSHAFLKRMNESAVAITWTQDPGIPDKHVEYYGYTVAYAEGSGDFTDGPSVPHNASITNPIMIVTNIQSFNEYYFKVRMYREMDGEKEYGLPSATTRIEPGSNCVMNHTDVFAAYWELIAIGVGIFLIITAIILIFYLLSRPEQVSAVSGDSEQNTDNVSTEDSVAQASVLPDNSADQPALSTEPLHCTRRGVSTN